MKSLRTISLVAVLATMLLATAATAAPVLSVYVGEYGVSQATIPVGFQNQTPLYIYLEEFDGCVRAFEYKLVLPDDLAIGSSAFAFPGALDFGSQWTGYAYGLGESVPLYQVAGDDPPLLLHTINVYSLDYTDLGSVQLQPYTGGTNPAFAPRYSDCQNDLHILNTRNALLAVTAVDNGGASWGAVKSLY